MVGLPHLDGGGRVDGFSTFFDAPMTAEHFSRKDEGLRTGTGRGEAPLGQQDVSTHLWHPGRLD